MTEVLSANPEIERQYTFVAIMFPGKDMGDHIELSERPELIEEEFAINHGEGIVYDYKRDLRGVTEALGVDDANYFNGAKAIYGRFIGIDVDWLYVQPIQYKLHKDRRGADQGLGDIHIRVRADSMLDGLVEVAALGDEAKYKDLLGKRRQRDDNRIPPGFTRRDWAQASMANLPK